MTEFKPKPITGPDEYYYYYAPTDAHCEVCGEYIRAENLKDAENNASAYTYGGMILKCRYGGKDARYDYGGGWAKSPQGAVDKLERQLLIEGAL